MVFSAVVGIGSLTHAQVPIEDDGLDKLEKPSVPVNKLTVVQMNAQSASMAGQVKEDLRHVMSLQQLARKEKDVIKLNCVNDKLVTLKAQSNIFDTLKLDLAAALESDGERRFKAFGEMQTAATEIKRTRQEADTCVGEPELFKQESSNLVKRPDLLDDPSSGPLNGNFGVEAPAYASPFN